ncbi:MAG TPA: DNA-processing protein DprA [Polyangiaceae bacterium]|nr:DNA-processing protein DprA [Polyangiaceae bacterium]
MIEKRPIVLTSGSLPPLLGDLPKRPNALFLRGELPRGPAVAIVGTRAPTEEGVQFAHELAAELAQAGVAILSGGARGIDTAAHRGALSVDGVTAVIAPAGFCRPYPPENAALFEEIVERAGAYAALVPDDQPATRPGFFARNACLAALCHALVLVQCGLRSGARNAVAHARRIGRPVFVVPSCPWIPSGRGGLQELRRGAELCEGARDVLRWLRNAGHQPVSCRDGSALAASPDSSDGTGLGDTEDGSAARVLALVEGGVTHVDELSRKTGLSVGVLQARLLELCLRGGLCLNPDGTYCRKH